MNANEQDNYTACCWFPTSSKILIYSITVSDKSGLFSLFKVTDCTVHNKVLLWYVFFYWTDLREGVIVAYTCKSRDPPFEYSCNSCTLEQDTLSSLLSPSERT